MSKVDPPRKSLSESREVEDVQLFLDQKIQAILKDAATYRAGEVKKQGINCLEWIAKFKDKKDKVNENGVPLKKYERDRFSNQMAKLFKACCESHHPRLVIAGLEFCEKLTSYEYFYGDTVDEENHSQRLISTLLKVTAECFKHTNDENVQLHIVRSFFAFIVTTPCDVHEGDLMTAVQTTYNVYLVTKNPNTRNASKVNLKRIINIIFQRMELQMSPDVVIGVDDQSFDEEALERTATETNANSNKTPRTPKGDQSASFLTGISSLFVAQKPVDLKEKKKELTEFCHSVVLSLVEYVEHTKKFERQFQTNHVFNDCFLLFRALCKLSMKEIPKENSADPDSLQIKSKILSLELLLQILEGSGFVLRACDKFINHAIKKHLILSLLLNGVSSNPRVFNLSLKIFLALVSFYKDYLKTEIGVFYSKIFLPILENPNSTMQHKRILLQALLELCKNPQALVDLFVNYDCDLNAIDIYERMVNVLSKIAQGTKGTVVTEADLILKHDGLECLVYIMRSLVNWSKDFLLEKKELRELEELNQKEESEENNNNNNTNNNSSSTTTPDTNHCKTSSTSEATLDTPTTTGSSVPDFGLLKQHKLLIRQGSEKFKKNEKKGLKWFIDQGLVKDTPEDIAEFFHRQEELPKAAIGDILGMKEDYYSAIRQHYVEAFMFKGVPIDLALRRFLAKFRLPGEAQKIDRIVEKFAERYYEQNKGTTVSPFANADAVYLFAFASVMLATDAHNPAISPERKMTKQQWYKQHQKGNDGNDFPEDFLSDVYDRIRSEPLKTSDTPTAVSNNEELTDPKQRREIFAQEMDNVIKSTRLTLKERSSDKTVYYRAKQIEHVKPMFDVAWMPLLAAFSVVLEDTDDSKVIAMCLDGFKNSIRVSCAFYLELIRKAFITALSKFTLLNNLSEMKDKNIECIKTLLEIAILEGNFLQDSWGLILRCISHLDQLQLLGQEGPAIAVSPTKRVPPPNTSHQRSASGAFETFEKENARKIRQKINSIQIDKVFSNTVNLDSVSIIDFVNALCQVSIDEIESPQPSMFSLQKLVELAHPNMDRIRIVWSRIWTILAEHFTRIGTSYSMQVSIYAIDSLKQLAMKFLEKEELTNYHFQKEFLRPFEVLMRTAKSPKVRDMIVGCILHMVTARAPNIKSGWKSIFAVLSLAGSDLDQNICSLAYQILQDVTEKQFALISDLFFVDCTTTLVSFGNNPKFVSISIKAINLLFNLADHLGNGEVCDLVEINNEKKFTDNETHMGLWFPILTGLSGVIGHPNVDIRATALNTLFEILKNHGKKFTPNLWKLIFRGVLSPIFDNVRHANSALQKEESEWLNQTCFPALDGLIKIFTLFFGNISFLLADMLDLISSCILQDNENLARIGATCFLQLLMNNGKEFDPEMWTMVCNQFSQLLEKNAPKELTVLESSEDFNNNQSAYARSRGINRIVQGKCLVQLGLIEALKDVSFQFYIQLETRHLVILLDALEYNFKWIAVAYKERKFVAAITKLGLNELLLREEIAILSCYLKIMFHMYSVSTTADRIELCEKRLIPRCEKVLVSFIEKTALVVDTHNEVKRYLVSYTPVVTQILSGIMVWTPAQFSQHLGRFYPVLTDLILCNNHEIRLLVNQFYKRLNELCVFQIKPHLATKEKTPINPNKNKMPDSNTSDNKTVNTSNHSKEKTDQNN